MSWCVFFFTKYCIVVEKKNTVEKEGSCLFSNVASLDGPVDYYVSSRLVLFLLFFSIALVMMMVMMICFHLRLVSSEYERKEEEKTIWW